MIPNTGINYRHDFSDSNYFHIYPNLVMNCPCTV